MPTAYTAPVADGISFKDFTLMCARAMGAAMHLREEPYSAGLTLKEPDNYYVKRLKEAQERLAQLRKMSLEDVKAKCAADRKERVAYLENRLSQIETEMLRYDAMLEQVKKWDPPTSDHAGLKTFMLDQLNDTISFDYNPSSIGRLKAELYEYKPEDPQEWLNDNIEFAERDIKFASKRLQDENINLVATNTWITKLLESIAKIKD